MGTWSALASSARCMTGCLSLVVVQLATMINIVGMNYS
ncbi:uncharacterized protein Asalp_11850 [Aeromonas salmonicida subsp. pectinolytica 34mel]|uniref:Uncharacterized protein n=1 Tax=Aeromonas salmonicida subsp. pectinolytica 34mel TaxID=1324960 RepID=A0A2D1QDT5_AERSA|nr:uncharacterized protein Asalp_11850 [Aeromonas salmonicida subsp. pectinolytica 34mel]